jgi:hypothetical protein
MQEDSSDLARKGLADSVGVRPDGFGQSDAPRARFGLPEITALACGIVWLAGAGLHHLMNPLPPGQSGAGLRLLAAIVPVLLLGYGAIVSLSLREVRAELRRLETSLAKMRKAAQTRDVGQNMRPYSSPTTPAPAPATATATATATSAARARPAETQTQLPFAVQHEPEPTPLSWPDLLEALDLGTGRAMRVAMANQTAGPLLRAAQDVLGLMQTHGFSTTAPGQPDVAPNDWRSFGRGERGGLFLTIETPESAQLLALIAARLRHDVVFRDAAHHFLRQFDRRMSPLLVAASDDDIAMLARTRTARAFVTLGRAVHIFD